MGEGAAGILFRSVAPLSEAVTAAKAGDPLAPVTVLTNSGYAAVFVRRALALGAADGTRAGIANVNATTLAALVRSIGVPRLATKGLRPVAPAVNAEALRAEALSAGGWLAQFAGHPRALAALQRAVSELGRCPPAVLQSLASQRAQTRTLVGLLEAVRRRLHSNGFADELDLIQAALEDAGGPGERHRDLGPVVTWRLRASPREETDFLLLLGALDASGSPRMTSTTSFSEIVGCSDAEEEARHAVRALLREIGGGAALWQQAIFHPPTGDYARLLHQQLTEAGVTSNGPAVTSLRGSTAARVLTGLLELAEGDFPRDKLTAWLVTAPIFSSPDGRRVPATRWDALSADAGVIRGLDQWRERLAHRAAAQESEAEDCAALSEFVSELAGRTAMPGGTWSDLSRWAKGLLDRYLPTPSDHRRPATSATVLATWPTEQVVALVQVRALLDSLADLDTVSDGCDLSTFRATVERSLESTTLDSNELGKGAFGDGVFVAPFGAARGLVFDQVVVCGLADGIVPGSTSVDPLVDDEVRQADTSGTLVTAAARKEDLLGDLRCVLHSGERRRVGTWPRCDPRSGRSQIVSRWTGELADTTTAWTSVDSFAAGIAANGSALSTRELDMRALDRWIGLGADPSSSPVAQGDPRFVSGFEAVTCRAGPDFTRFDGSVGAGAVSPFDPETPVSATRFETYAHCPRRYVFERALRVSARVAPEELWRIEPIDRGTLVHKILELYVRERLAGAPRSLDRLLCIAREQLDETEAGGRVGRRLLWRMDRAAILRELRRFDSEEGDLEPLSAELAFGGGEEGELPPVIVTLDGGREVRFRGSADRVDRSRSGRIVVSDYKTGKQTSLSSLMKDPVAGGKLLQLPLYGLAARAAFANAQTEDVHARYWLLSSERGAPCYHLVVTKEVEDRFREVVGRIASGVEAGCFPGIPGNALFDGKFDNCWTCDFDSICPVQRDRQWGRKQGDARLRPVLDLLHDEVPPTLAGAVVKGFVDPDEAGDA